MTSKRRRVHVEEEHENHERWLVSYSDMLTVLFALFVVLYASSSIDTVKYAQLRHSLQEGFGSSSSAPFDGGDGILDGLQPTPPEKDTVVEIDGQTYNAADLTEAQKEYDRLTDLAKSLEADLKAGGHEGAVEYRITERGLAVGMIANEVFFQADGSALSASAQGVLDIIGPALKPLSNEILVEGHANNKPTTRYPSNWELSTERATSVVRRLITESGVPSKRLAAVGYGSARPLFPNTTAEGVEGNRRVDLTILSTQPERIRELIPLVAKTLGKGD